MVNRKGRQIMDGGGPVITREYVYTRNDGSGVIIQDHRFGQYRAVGQPLNW